MILNERLITVNTKNNLLYRTEKKNVAFLNLATRNTKQIMTLLLWQWSNLQFDKKKKIFLRESEQNPVEESSNKWTVLLKKPNSQNGESHAVNADPSLLFVGFMEQQKQLKRFKTIER